MRKDFLIIDVSFLCFRAYHIFRDLMHKDEYTGVSFGFLKEILFLQQYFNTERVVFCFDRGPGSKRREIMPEYKSQRRENHRMEAKPFEREKPYKEIMLQADRLRTEYLPEIGFRNLLSAPGLEGDDFVAAAALTMRGQRHGIIISADKDLYQCLTPNVSMHNPLNKAKGKPLVTYKTFKYMFGIEPKQWARVKAMAGCTSDSVPGIKGVGGATAISFLKGILPHFYKTYGRITSQEGIQTTRRNLPIVKLPFKGTPEIQIVKDETNRGAWDQVARKLGADSLIQEKSKVKPKRKRSERPGLFDREIT